MQSRFFTYLMLLLFPAAGFSQGAFQKYLVQAGTESYGMSVVQAPDSTYVVCGASNQSGFYTDAILTKLDTIGNIIWAKRYGGEFIDWSKEVVNTKDGGFALAGYTNSFGNGGYDFYLIKTDANGNKQWDKTYGGTDWDLAHGLIQLPDSGYVLAGETYSYGNGNKDAYLVRTDKNGDTLWTRTYGEAGDEVFYSIAYIGNGSIVAAGKAKNASTQETDGFMVRVDTSGNTIWQEYFGSAQEDDIRGIKQNADGNIVSMGSTNAGGDYKLHMLVVDTNTRALLVNHTDGGNLDDFGFDVAQNSNRDYYLAGTTQSYGNYGADGKNDLVFYQFSEGISFLASATEAQGVIGVSEEVHSIKACFDDGLVAAGTSVVNGNSVIYVIRYRNLLQTVTPPTNANFVTTAIPERAEEKILVDVYPNPFHQELFYKSNQPITHIHVYDITGKRVAVFYTKSPASVINLSDIPAGMYIFEAFTEGLNPVRFKIQKL